MRSEAVDRIFAAKKKKKRPTSFFFLHCSSNVRTKSRGFRQFYMKTAESFFCVYILSSKHEEKLGGLNEVMQTLDTIKALQLQKVSKTILDNSCCLFIFCNELIQDLESSASGRTSLPQHVCNPPVTTQPYSPPLPSN